MSEQEPVEYTSPAGNLEKGEEPRHTFYINLDGETIAGAEVDYYSKPIPCYQVTDLAVDYNFQGIGHASRIMSQVEAFLKERRKAGVLVDAILDGPAAGMYERRGWTPVPSEPALLVFNLPKGVDPDIFRNYALRQTDITGRDSWKKLNEETSD